MIWAMNAQELMTIARKRLCTKAAPETRQAVQLMCDEVLKTNPEFSGLLEPMCSYLNGSCREFEPCGRYKEYTEFSND
jgi:thymidylate synthase ThyX